MIAVVAWTALVAAGFVPITSGPAAAVTASPLTTAEVTPIIELPTDLVVTYGNSTERFPGLPKSGGSGNAALNAALRSGCSVDAADPQWYALPPEALGTVQPFHRMAPRHSPLLPIDMKFAYLDARTLTVLQCDANQDRFTVTGDRQVLLAAYTTRPQARCDDPWADDCYGDNISYQLHQVGSAPPANDRWQDATSITSLPFTDTVDTSLATPDFEFYDVSPCTWYSDGSRRADVWWRYTPATTGSISVKSGWTRGYRSYLALYRLTPDGPVQMDERAEYCEGGTTPELTAGETYLINIQHVQDPWGPIEVGGPVTLSVGGPDSLLPPEVWVTNSSPSSARLVWSLSHPLHGAPLTGYRVARDGTDINGVGPWSTTVAPTTSSQTFTNLVPWSAYTFTVQAVRGSEVGPATERLLWMRAPTPSAPGPVTASPGSGKVTVTWSPPTFAGDSVLTGYRVRRYSSSGTLQQTITVPPSTTSSTFGSLTNGTAYRFDVAAVNASGTGVVSARTPAVKPVGLPVAPTSVRATKNEKTKSVTLKWSPPAGNGGSAITGYRVTRNGTDASGRGPVTKTLSSGARSVAFKGLKPGSKYTVTVAAINALGVGTSVKKSITLTTPGVPRSVTAIAKNGKITLTWKAPTFRGTSAITGYQLRRFRGTGDTVQQKITVGPKRRSYTFTGLKNGTAYTFDVTAKNSSGKGPASPRTPVVRPKAS